MNFKGVTEDYIPMDYEEARIKIALLESRLIEARKEIEDMKKRMCAK